MNRRPDRTFVFCACGDSSVADLNFALGFARWAISRSRNPERYEIIVLAARVTVPVQHIRIIPVDIPEHFSDAQASRYLKTGPHRFIPEMHGTYCYLDNDAFIVSPNGLKVFEFKKDVVQMASDQFVTVKKFSKPSLNYGNLPDAIRYYFGIDVDPEWRLWNSGVYLFDAKSKAFLDTWHQLTVRTFDLPQWKVKDQAALVAAVWKHGLQRIDRIPSTYNWLFGMSERGKAKTLFTGKGFKFRKSKIDILHFIGGTRNVDKKEWLDAFRLIMSEKSDEFRAVRKYQSSVIKSKKAKAGRLKTAVGLFVLRRLWAVSMVLRNNVPGYAKRLDAFKDKLNERSLGRSAQSPIDGQRMSGTL